jgi:hypothetical protein
LSHFVFDDLPDSFVLGQGHKDIRLIGAGIDDLRRLGIRRIESALLLLGQAREIENG